MNLTKRTKFIVIAAIVIFFILTITVFNFYKNKYKQILELQNQNKELQAKIAGYPEYQNKLIQDIQELNQAIPDLEKEIRNKKLRLRCDNDQLQRILNKQQVEPGYCDKQENLEKYSEVKKETAQVETVQAVF